MKIKFLASAAVISAMFCANALACTTILVGQGASKDGSMLIARSADSKAIKAQVFLIHPKKTNQKGIHSSKAHNGANDFTYPLPKEGMRYTTIANSHTRLHGAVGYNDAGVGISGTETIYAKDELLKIDPYNEATGITEDDIPDVLLPRMKSAAEGVKLLGEIVETTGAGEGFGVVFVDKDELWYFETGTGHHWMAAKLPKDEYFVSANQGRLQNYKENDPNFMGSKNLIKFAQDNGAYDPAKDGEFQFTKAYTRDDERDMTYNYPRVWGLQAMFSPAIENDVTKNTFPVFAKAEHPLSLDDLRRAFRFHYQGTEHDPYLHNNPKEKYRPVSIFRTTQTHLLQVRPELPQAIGCINYVAMGMADLGVFLPLYQGITSYPEAYTKGTGESSADSAYWKFRKVMVLGMTNYNKYAPVIKEAYAKFEAETDQRQREMEEEYLRIYKTQPLHAQDLLQAFSDRILNSALTLADRLQERLFTLMTQDIQQEYLFHGA